MTNEDRLEYLDAQVKSLSYQLEEAQDRLKKYEETLRLYNRLICALND